jgi:hypothetical protein
MSLRIRKDGTVWCAVMNPEMDGDIYIDDTLHHYLHQTKKVLRTWPEPEHSQRAGQWFWVNDAPKGMEDWSAQAHSCASNHIECHKKSCWSQKP